MSKHRDEPGRRGLDLSTLTNPAMLQLPVRLPAALVNPLASHGRSCRRRPVLSDEDEALRLANDIEYSLAATVWSKDIDVAIRTARIGAGTVAVNRYSDGDISTPFGGYRMSGFGGRDNGLEALEQYTEVKTIWVTPHRPRHGLSACRRRTGCAGCRYEGVCRLPR